MRVLISLQSKEKLFRILKKKNNAKTLKELAEKLKINFKTLKGYRYENRYIPDFLILSEIKPSEILDKKDNNWGAIEGGKIGGKRSAQCQRKKLGEEAYSNLMRQKAKCVKNTIWKRHGKALIKMTVQGKIKKRELESKELEKSNKNYFTNEKVFFNSEKISFSKHDKCKKLTLPEVMSKELAEEIGVHMGDGCLSTKNYFSVKCNKTEKEYFTSHLLRLYKKLYNLDLRLMHLNSVCGFEIYSKALCEFKNKELELPTGKKVGKLKIPKKVLDTRNRKIYFHFIRGLFDTDGCIYLRDRRYPVISITIKSKRLIDQLHSMFRKLGYIPTVYKYTITLNGPTMLKKWIKEIGSKNTAKIRKMKKASSIVDSTWFCGD